MQIVLFCSRESQHMQTPGGENDRLVWERMLLCIKQKPLGDMTVPQAVNVNDVSYWEHGFKKSCWYSDDDGDGNVVDDDDNDNDDDDGIENDNDDDNEEEEDFNTTTQTLISTWATCS